MLVISTGTGYYFGRQKPAEIIEKQVIKRDVVTHTIEITKPNGEHQIETIISDQSKISNEKDTYKRVSAYLVGGHYNISTSAYSVTAYRRIIGPVFAGVGISSDRQISVNLLMEF